METPGILRVDQFEELPALIQETLGRLARGERNELAACLVSVETDTLLNKTKARSHVYFLAHDANGRPQVSALARAICHSVVDYAIPRTRIAAAYEQYEKTGSSRAITELVNEATELFTDLKTTGEGGELLLFVLAETVLRLPQVICKMSIKTSSQMHYHGADGAHASFDEDTGRLALWWGESKIHKNPANAVRECMESIAPFLLEPFGKGTASSRDMQLLANWIDIHDPQLESAIKNYVDPNSVYFNKLEYRAICLVGFDDTCYSKQDSDPSNIQREVDETIKGVMSKWKNQVVNRVIKERIAEFHLHVFLVPFPSVDSFRSSFLTELGLNK